ncbi:hypothetical protein BLNAU_10016 [Blattamonas nauphoetae]|uniref:Uncharacterized protein n=1 Tax=Blattamonas nauphoetae TaxID=2049346 RepID=A0ABQ9XUE1_9EUKA|nr:hypothetical protein BLNAU_10016 [Blattamonas nauphoetae]
MIPLTFLLCALRASESFSATTEYLKWDSLPNDFCTELHPCHSIDHIFASTRNISTLTKISIEDRATFQNETKISSSRFRNTSSVQKTHALAIGGGEILEGHGTFVLEGSSQMHLAVTLKVTIISDRTPVGTKDQKPYLIKVLSEATLAGTITLYNPRYSSFKEYEALNIPSLCFDESTETGAVVHVDKGKIASTTVVNNYDPEILVYDFIDLSAYSKDEPLNIDDLSTVRTLSGTCLRQSIFRSPTSAYVTLGTISTSRMYNLINKGVTFSYVLGGDVTNSTSSIQREPEWKSIQPALNDVYITGGKLIVSLRDSNYQLYHCSKDKYKVYVSPRRYDQEIELNTNFKQLEYEKTYKQTSPTTCSPVSYLLDKESIRYSLPFDAKVNPEFLEANWVTIKIEGPEKTNYIEYALIKSEL